MTKLDATGSGLVYSTYLGGSETEFRLRHRRGRRGQRLRDGLHGSTDFPTTAGAVQTTHAGGFDDAFVTKLDATGSGLVYSTYLGGSDRDGGFGIAVDGAGSAYVTGRRPRPISRRPLGQPRRPPPAIRTLLLPRSSTLPTSTDQCKNGGWKTFGVFKNQGDCVSFVASKGKNPPSVP